MWTKIIVLMTFLFIAGCSTVKMKYPHTLLGEHFGILTEEDLAISSCTADAIPFSKESHSHHYWQCFLTEKSHLDCFDAEYDYDEKSEMTIMAIVVQKDGIKNEYLSRRVISLKACIEFANQWKRLIEGQKHVCISGAYINSENSNQSWVFESFKTFKGCDSYFEGGCSLKYNIEHGCELPT